ncbi:lactococcin 972 family bacteriocin [Clostridium estertheticum]|uniref:lactococcin 972 family bacteriocin n=1 Tax=Clostridium estertheticum TaxID=238834 RepID=UPI001C0CFE2B|nr:lactococcin 972 family bacteriocin [Clostridium estertheticum]MBU3179368.1 lactococcin 972 family bacteriocin [Clostridium estertheticum]
MLSKTLVVIIMISSIMTLPASAQEQEEFPYGYSWIKGTSLTITLKHIQYSRYEHAKKSHSASAMVDSVYDKDSEKAGVVAYASVTGARNPKNYNLYYNFW